MKSEWAFPIFLVLLSISLSLSDIAASFSSPPQKENLTEAKPAPVKPNKPKRVGPCEKFAKLFDGTENQSRLLAQCEQESGGRPTAKSPFAEGLMQFTPQTAKWAEGSFCRHLGKARLENPWWSAKCGAAYMQWLEKRTPTDGDYCSTKRNAERSYNGGLGWLKREAKLTNDHSYIGLTLVCLATGRKDWACEENTGYAPHISRRQPKYAHHGGKQC